MRKWQAGALALAAAAVLQGCSTLGYLTQAAAGQASLMGQARPIDEWVERADVNPKLKRRLAMAQKIRRFAIDELGLPENESYTSYAELRRPYVLWNVVAAPELSLKAKTWCFPIAGCVSYRGYYDEAEAKRAAGELRAAGYDVEVGGVAAYSTLGWFSDPLLSTFIHRSEPDLAGLIFHELAHQVVYAPGDTRFNESFASAVEEAGVERWLARSGVAGEALRAAWVKKSERERQFKALLLGAREDLKTLYASQERRAAKSSGKRERIARLKADYAELKTSWGGFAGYDRWFESEPSNASLASVGAYHDHVAAFRELMAQSQGMPAFYKAAKALADLPERARSTRLERLSEQSAARAQKASEALGGAALAGAAGPFAVK